MKAHTEEVQVNKHNAIFIRGGWSMICPVCGKSVASGSTGVRMPLFKTCFGDKNPSVI